MQEKQREVESKIEELVTEIQSLKDLIEDTDSKYSDNLSKVQGRQDEFLRETD